MFVSIHSYSSESWDGKNYKVESDKFTVEKENEEQIKITASNFEVPNTGERGGAYLERHRDLTVLISKNELAEIVQFAIENNFIELKAIPKK